MSVREVSTGACRMGLLFDHGTRQDCEGVCGAAVHKSSLFQAHPCFCMIHPSYIYVHKSLLHEKDLEEFPKSQSLPPFQGHRGHFH